MPNIITRSRVLGLSLGLALMTCATVAVAGAAAEVYAATNHALLAAKATDIDGVHQHLHHVVNCLVGPGGQGFDAKEMNPCANAGKGAIPDLANASTAQKNSLHTAYMQAMLGIFQKDLTKAKASANNVVLALQAVR